jgi:hypothetical protein
MTGYVIFGAVFLVGLGGYWWVSRVFKAGASARLRDEAARGAAPSSAPA